MKSASDADLRPVNVGLQGLAGFHNQMIQNVNAYVSWAVIAYGLLAGVTTLPSGLEIYRISRDLTVMLLLKYALVLWALYLSWHLIVALWFALRWITLELKGMQWVRRNDHNFRVEYYRRDGSLKYNRKTRDDRLNEELRFGAVRRQTLLRETAALILNVAVYALLPAAYFYSYQFMNAWVHSHFDQWRVLHLAKELWLYLRIVPTTVLLSVNLFEWATYLCGAQYIPGAKLRDAVIHEKTLETMRAEQSLGRASITAPELAARLLGSSR